MNSHTLVDPDLVEMMESVFAGHRTTVTDRNDDAMFDHKLWTSLTDLGLARLTGSEASGGSAADWHSASALLGAAAAAATPIPAVEHDLLAGWLLETAGLSADAGLQTATLLVGNSVDAIAPWARYADSVVVLRGSGSTWSVAQVSTDDIEITPSNNIAGEPRDRVRLDVDAASWAPVSDEVAQVYVLRGALARTLQMCGAMERIVELSIDHVTTRTQFGRPLSKFQAVQRLVTGIATESALARAAADAAIAQTERNGWDSSSAGFVVAVAKSCAGHAASTTVRNAHQVHGAIGTTYEHQLHRFTRPALAWRSEFGGIDQWDRLIAGAARSAGRDDLWSLVTRGGRLPDLLGLIQD